MKKNSTVLVCGNFNVIHPGHLRLLRFAKEQGERLIVGVYSDRIAGGSAYVSEQLRLDELEVIILLQIHSLLMKKRLMQLEDCDQILL